MRIAVDSAHRMGAAAPLAKPVCGLWDKSADMLGPGLDQDEVVRYREQASGVTL